MRTVDAGIVHHPEDVRVHLDVPSGIVRLVAFSVSEEVESENAPARGQPFKRA